MYLKLYYLLNSTSELPSGPGGSFQTSPPVVIIETDKVFEYMSKHSKDRSPGRTGQRCFEFPSAMRLPRERSMPICECLHALAVFSAPSHSKILRKSSDLNCLPLSARSPRTDHDFRTHSSAEKTHECNLPMPLGSCMGPGSISIREADHMPNHCTTAPTYLTFTGTASAHSPEWYS